jgi:hypothetical protein
MKDAAYTDYVEQLCKRHATLNTHRASWDSFWQDVANFVMPRKAQINTITDTPTTEKFDQLYDSTAIQANETLASGLVSLMSPAESRWFSFDPPPAIKENDESAQWFTKCTEVVQLELAKSNFYTEIHELHLDRGCFGTSAIFVSEGKRSALNFRKIDVGTFSLSEDEEGMIDTIYRDFKMSYRQLVSMFGEDALSPKHREFAMDPQRMDQKIDVIHAIFPRSPKDIDPTKSDALNKPFASIYFDAKEKHLFSQGGYAEQPFCASRYLKWGDQVYGMSPSWIALPDARQLNFLEKQMDALAEIKAFPRVLIPEGMEGAVDLRAGGATYFDPSAPNAMPREWATQGDYMLGKDRAEIKRQSIRDAFHVGFFQMFAQIDKQMTAREVSERASEKLMQFSSTATLLTTELFNPLLQRVWGICARAGLFPPPPDIFVQFGFIPEPQVTYSSRVALAIKSMENQAFLRHSEAMMAVWQLQPEILDNYNMDEIMRDMSRNDGFPARWLRETKEIQQLRQMRAEQAAAQAEMEQQLAQAQIAKDAGSVPADSPVAQAAVMAA